MNALADEQRLMVIMSLTALHAILFRQVEKKLVKTVWGMHKRVSVSILLLLLKRHIRNRRREI